MSWNVLSTPLLPLASSCLCPGGFPWAQFEHSRPAHQWGPCQEGTISETSKMGTLSTWETWFRVHLLHAWGVWKQPLLSALMWASQSLPSEPALASAPEAQWPPCQLADPGGASSLADWWSLVHLLWNDSGAIMMIDLTSRALLIREGLPHPGFPIHRDSKRLAFDRHTNQFEVHVTRLFLSCSLGHYPPDSLSRAKYQLARDHPSRPEPIITIVF